MKPTQNALTSATVTMTSLELVDFINNTRDIGEAELRHDHFMAKVPKVLGADAPKFLGTQNYGNNNTREVYNFPKREACLMAMSYSYELQAKVFDRMTELEATKAPALVNPPQELHNPSLQLIVEQATELDGLERQISRLARRRAELAKALPQANLLYVAHTPADYLTVEAYLEQRNRKVSPNDIFAFEMRARTAAKKIGAAPVVFQGVKLWHPEVLGLAVK